MIRHIRWTMVPVFALALWALQSWGDTVYLKNNERMEGRVIRENEKEITLDFGFGETIINREKIVKIEKGPFPAKTDAAPAKAPARPAAATPVAETPPPSDAMPLEKPAPKKPPEAKKPESAAAKKIPPRRIGAAAQEGAMPMEENTGKK